MVGLRNIIVFTVCLIGVFASPTPASERDDSIVNWGEFRKLLSSVDEGVLHNVLHQMSPKYKDGVFSRDHSALERIHSENPVIASKMVHVARKRQATNTSITTTTLITSSTVTVTSTSTSTVSTSAPISSTVPPSSRTSLPPSSSSTAPPSSSSTPPSSSAPPSTSSTRAIITISSTVSTVVLTSVVPAAITVVVAPSTPSGATPIATKSGAVIFSTVGGGIVTLTSTPVQVSYSPSTSVQLVTSTLPDGSVKTSTFVVVVNAPITATGLAVNAPSGTTGSSGPGLQNGASSTMPSILRTLTAAFMTFAGLALLL